MRLVSLSDATSLRDSQFDDLLAQLMTPSPLVLDRQCTKSTVRAIRPYAEALFSAPYLIGLLLELGASPVQLVCVV